MKNIQIYSGILVDKIVFVLLLFKLISKLESGFIRLPVRLQS